MKNEKSGEPNIGIFYIIGSKIYKSAEKFGCVNTDPDGFKNYALSHYEYWDTVCQSAPEHKGLDYDYFPRGRITYSCADDMFFVRLDGCIDDAEHHALISGAFHLHSENTVFEVDDLYNCFQCL